MNKPDSVNRDQMTFADRCKLFCEWMGGSPCARDDCPRRELASARRAVSEAVIPPALDEPEAFDGPTASQADAILGKYHYQAHEEYEDD